MSQIIINGQPLYQVDLPEMTLAEWLALPVAERPKEWIRTDGSPCLYYENDMMPASYPASRVTHESVSVTADGTKTYSQMFDALYALLDITKVTPHSLLMINKNINQLILLDSSELHYTMCCFNTSNGKVDNIFAKIMSTGSKYYNQTADGTISDFSSSIVSNGRVITLYY